MMCGVRDKGNYLIKWFDTEKEAKAFIKKRDPHGNLGYHVIKS